MSFLEDLAKTNLFSEIERLKEEIEKLKTENRQKDDAASPEVIGAWNKMRIAKAELEEKTARVELDRKRAEIVYSDELAAEKAAREVTKLQQESLREELEQEKLRREAMRIQASADKEQEIELLRKTQEEALTRKRHAQELAIEENKAAIILETEKLKAEIELKKQELKKADLETEMLRLENARSEEEDRHTDALSAREAAKHAPTVPPDPLARIDTIQNKLKLEVPKYRWYALSYIGFSVVYLGLATGAFFLFDNKFQCPYAAILLFLACTAIWTVATAGIFFLLKAVSKRSRENAERHDKLLHILNERRLHLLDKES